MDYKKAYESRGVPEKDWVLSPRHILLTVPAKDYDASPVLAALGLARCEVTVTYPKSGIEMQDEVFMLAPRLVVQLGQQFSRRYHFLPDGALPDDELKGKVQAAVGDSFVVLHHHDEFSLQDGLGTCQHLAELLREQRRSFMAVTNHGSVGGWIKQFNVCREYGIKPIFGMECYVENYRGTDPEEKKKHRSAFHLVLLAATKEGFYNIIRIHNDAQVHGFYYSPRADHEAFKKWGKGIIATSACAAGEIPRALMADEWAKAEELCRFYMSVFDGFYLELQIIETEMQREINRRIIQLAAKLNCPLVLACDSHYLKSEHAETHSLLMYIRQRKTVHEVRELDVDVWDFDVKNLFYRNGPQMEDVFRNGFVEGGKKCAPFLDDVFTEEVFRQAMENTLAIARKVDDIALDSKVKLPKLYADSRGMLREKVNQGFRDRQLNRKRNRQDYMDRLRMEFEVINKMGFADYFLIMERIISDAKKAFGEWVIGYGRGSAAGSLISYCLGLTDIDPLEYGLLFERFLDESRTDPPDIDTDFDPRYRDSVKEEIVKTFGADNTCSIGTYQTYKTRAVIIDVAKALGLDSHEAFEVTKKLGSMGSMENEEGEDEKMDNLSFEELCEQSAELKAYFQANPDVRYHAELLRNQVKNMSTHAGGMIISDLNLKDRIPIFEDDHGRIVSAWTESGNSTELSSVGLVKYDILGLNNLCVISDCVKLIEQTKGKAIARWEIPISDREAIRMGGKRDFVGIFQFENPATKSVADAVEMESIGDVSAVTSLIRPGPRDMGMDMEYARRKHGEPYDMPDILKEMLKDTYGVLTYQEQCMRISRELCGFTGPEANKLRKAIGKKKKDVMAAMKDKFLKGARSKVEAGVITADKVDEVWSLIERFAGYGFNASHAYSYSAITCVELWLKYHYPVEYLTALLNNTKPGKKKFNSQEDLLAVYINYARKRNFDVLGPDINRSREDFSTDGTIILFSLRHVKNVANAATVLVANQPYKDMADFYERAMAVGVSEKTGKATKKRVNKKVVESLVAAGAFSAFGTKNEVMQEYYRLRKDKDPVPQHTDAEWQALEVELIGLCLSTVPLRRKYQKLMAEKKWCPIDEADERQRTKVFGRIASIVPKTSRKGNSMYVVELTDDLDSMRFFVFGGAMVTFKDNFKVGYVAAIPLNRFEDSDTRFFDVDRESEIVEK